MGVRTRVFGKYAWLLFEGVARFYDEYMQQEQDPLKRLEMMDLAREFFHLIGFVLPCVYCRISYREFISTDIDVNYMLTLKDGAKMLVYKLHNRVTKKLWDQERDEFANDPQKLQEINAKWQKYSISYEQALAERFPSVESFRFWNAAIIFLALVMCDYRTEDSCHIYRFYWLMGRMLARCQSVLGVAYARGLELSLPLWKSRDSDEKLSVRLDIVWVIMNHVFAVRGWKFSRTRSDFEEQCKASIVGCKK